jgi:hypothetical protein
MLVRMIGPNNSEVLHMAVQSTVSSPFVMDPSTAALHISQEQVRGSDGVSTVFLTDWRTTPTIQSAQPFIMEQFTGTSSAYDHRAWLSRDMRPGHIGQMVHLRMVADRGLGLLPGTTPPFPTPPKLRRMQDILDGFGPAQEVQAPSDFGPAAYPSGNQQAEIANPLFGYGAPETELGVAKFIDA